MHDFVIAAVAAGDRRKATGFGVSERRVFWHYGKVTHCHAC